MLYPFYQFRRLSRPLRLYLGGVKKFRAPSKPGTRQFFVFARRTSTKLAPLPLGQSPFDSLWFRFYTSGSSEKGGPKGALRQKIWRILRVLLLVTGGAVWGIPVLAYLGYQTGFVEIDIREKEEEETRKFGSDEYNDRMLTFYDVPKDIEGDARATEIRDKQFALMKIWHKLRSEDGVVKKFGKPVQLSGFQVMANMIADHFFGSDGPNIIPENQEAELMNDVHESETVKIHISDLNWTASCYVEGPKLTGVLQVEFNKVNAEWIPVSLHLETIQKTGVVICNVSGPLPNGVSRFTRLSND